MEIKQSYQIYELLQEKIEKTEYKFIICKNIKKFRTELYNGYKEKFPKAEGINNPYSTDNVCSYLGISRVHYKRIENENDKNKNITLDNLIKLSYILNKKLDDFLIE